MKETVNAVLSRVETKIDQLSSAVTEMRDDIKHLANNDSHQASQLAVLDNRVGTLESARRSVTRVVLGVLGSLLVAAVVAIVTIL